MPTEQPLQDDDKRFRLLFQDHPQPMWVIDANERKFLEVNAAAGALYGYSPEEFRALSWTDVLVAEDTRRLTAQLRKPDRPSTTVWRHRTKAGNFIDVEMAVHEISYGGRTAYLAVLMDITGRRRLEEQLRQSQKMEAVGMLAGGVAHDFNNLLTIITGYSQLILNSLGASDPNRHSAEQIMKAGERAAALTRQLLAFSRRQVLQPQVLELNKLVTGMSAMLRRLIGEDIDLRLILPAAVGRVNADPGQMEQVLMNLVVNARDAMPAGGTLTIETANVQLDRNSAGRHVAVRPGPYVLLAVSDSGVGMDEATQAHLFEPFFTTKSQGKGTGLGLSTVFGIVKQSGGSVQVYSELGKGTSVKVYLPRIGQPAAAGPGGSSRPVARGTETILVVEDDEMVRHLVRDALERDGYKVLEAAGPLEARSTAESYRGAIHLLITDVVMPKLSGRELAGQLGRRRPQMKILYISGYADGAVVTSGVLEKGVAFLQKPFTPAALTAKVREVIEGDGGFTQRAGE